MPQQSSRRRAQRGLIPEDERREKELERASNRLLQASIKEKGRGEYPFYSQYWLRRLCQRDTNLEYDLQCFQPQLHAAICEVILRLLTRVPMRKRQRKALSLIAAGMSLSEAARRMKVTPTQVRRWVQAGAAKIREYMQDMDPLLNQNGAILCAYREDLARRGYRPEKHCKPGSELCRRTGLCPRRWYLYHAESGE